MGGPGELAFATRVPGHIVPVEVAPGNEYMIHRHGFLCATAGINLSVGFQQSLGAGIFGGDGFLLQKVGGQGMAWLELSGELVQRDLRPGETLLVHPGHVGAFQAGVSFQITMVRGIKNLIFGGDGIFLAVAHRPGTHLAADPAHLQTRPPDSGVPARATRPHRRSRSPGRHRRLSPRRHALSNQAAVQLRKIAASFPQTKIPNAAPHSTPCSDAPRR